MVTGSVNLIPEAPVAVIRDLAVRAEELGFGRCWVNDEGLATRDVYVTMAAILRSTERLVVGPGVTNAYTRHPGQTAAAIATLAEMSAGRAFLGLGAGGSLTLDPLGLERQQPLETIRQTIAACRGLFAGDRISVESPAFAFRSARLDYGRADIEIWLAGRGPRMLELGGAECDGVMLDFIHKPSLGDYTARVRSGAELTGNHPQICYSTMVVTDEETLEIVRHHMTYRLVDSPLPVREALGMTDADSERIRSALPDGLAAAARYVPDEWVLPFVIAGTEGECAAEVAALCEVYGLDEFVIPVLDASTGTAVLEVAARVLAS
ncbi:MAG: LLM class flavin-dependent oxidoreductase [Actinomycetota bacterium]|nr:LLM class flavin-dependent oxidoreductase [Actinomycetota bacterium]